MERVFRVGKLRTDVLMEFFKDSICTNPDSSLNAEQIYQYLVSNSDCTDIAKNTPNVVASQLGRFVKQSFPDVKKKGPQYPP